MHEQSIFQSVAPTDLPDGLIFRIRVKPGCENIRFYRNENHVYVVAHPAPQEGRFAIVTDVGSGMRWTHRLRKTSAAGADGEVVWS
jgi:hypothetical protein